MRDIAPYLRGENIPLENAILKMLYEYSLGFDKALGEFHQSLLHDETRRCLFDRNGVISDVVYSFDRTQLCVECRASLQKSGVPINTINQVNKELGKLKKKLFYRMLGWVKKHPIYSIIISSIVAVAINVISAYLYDFLK